MSETTYTYTIVANTQAADASVAKLENRMQSLGNAKLDGLNRSLGGTTSGLNQTGIAASSAAQKLSGANDNAMGLVSTFGNLGGGASDLTNKLSGVSNMTGNVTGKMAMLATGVTIVAGALYGLSQAASPFLDKIAEISTLVDTTKFDLDGLTKSILEQSAAFGKSPVETAAAAYEIVSSGAEDAATAVDWLTQSNMLAVGGVTSVAIAADGLTSVVAAYGPAVLSAADASDSMFIAMNLGKTTIGELSTQLGQAAPLAAQMGVSFDELTSSIAALTKGGVSTSIAVTGVRAILSSIAKPTKEAGDMAAALGLQFNTAALKAQGFAGFMETVKAKTGGNVDALSQLFGGVEALVPVLALTGQAGVDFNTAMDAMATKTGTTQEAFDKLANSPGFQMNRMLTTISVAAVQMGTSLATSLVPVMKFVADNFFGVAQAAKVLLTGFLAFKAATLVATFVGTGTALTRLGAIATGLNKVIGVSTAVWRVFNTTLKANPLIFIATSVGTVIGLLYSFRDSIKFGSDGVATLGDVARTVFGYITPAVTAVGEVFSSVFGAIGGFLSSTFGGMWDTVSGFFGNFDLSLEGAVNFAGFAFDAIYNVGAGAFALISSIWNDFPGFLKACFAGAVNGAAFILEGFINFAISGFNKLIEGVNQLVGPLGDLVGFSIKIPTVADVSLGRMDGGDWVGNTNAAIAGATGSTMGIDGARKFRKDVDETAKKRLAGGQPATSPVAPPATGGGNIKLPGDDKKEKEAKEKADKAAQKLAEIQAKYDEYFVTMTEGVKLAGMLPMQAAQYNAELELRKILGDGELANARELTQTEKDRIKLLRDQTNSASLIRDMKVAERDATFESGQLAARGLLIALHTGDKLEDALKLEERMAAFKKTALDNEVDMRSEAFQQQFATTQAVERENIALERRNDLLRASRDRGETYGKEALRTDGTFAQRKSTIDSDRDKAVADLRARFAEGTAEYQAGLRRANREHTEAMKALPGMFMEDFNGVIGQLAQTFTGKFGEAIDSLGRIINQLSNDPALGGMITKLFGKGSPLVAGMKKFGEGAAMGGEIAGLAKAIGVKNFSSTGAQIGGGIGSFLPIPGGQILGSIAGGLIGGLFSGPKQNASATISSVEGDAVMGGTKTNKQLNKAVSGLAGAVQSGISDIAKRLGGTANGGFKVSIGTYDGDYRVSTSGQGGEMSFGKKNKQKSTLHDFGDDSAAAIQFAIDTAISQGAITGLSQTAKNALAKLGAESAIALMDAFGAITREMDAWKDPVGSAVRELNRGLDSLKTQLLDVGAASEDIAKLEEYRAKKLDDILNESTKALTSLRESLMGEGSGRTALTRLNEKMGQFGVMQADIAAGKQVDQNAFATLAGDIKSLAGGLYGTSTSQFQTILSQLVSATDGAIGNVRDAYESANLAAIDRVDESIRAGLDEVSAQVGIGNDYLRQIAEGISNGGGGTGGRYSVERNVQVY